VQITTVVAVQWGNYLGRSIEYIDKLRAGVARHLLASHWFVCLRLDDSPLSGWWKKLEIFRPGRFTGRCLYLDLDSVIVGGLDPLVYRKGAVHLTDWGWARNVHAGGTLVWDAEIEGRRIWEAYTPQVPGNYENDQEWMTSLGVWEPLPAHLVRSYRYHCKAGVPEGASVIAHHGKPKPHELPPQHWIHEHWRT